MAIESNCSDRDFEKEWQQLNPNFYLFPRHEHVNKENKITVLAEAYSISPQNYNIDLLKPYKTVITWNSKFYNKYKDNLLPNLHLIQDPFGLWFNLHPAPADLSSFVPYEQKINGVCLVSNLKTYFDCNEGAIGYKRLQVMNNISGLIKHIYGGKSCGPMYKGCLGTKDPRYTFVDLHATRYEKIKKINQYKFNLCFENVYHEFWSWDYITEKIWDSFLAKSIPVYFGCYNIEQRIPKKYYIDYRDFKSDGELSKYLQGFSRDKYIEMVEGAYIYYKETEPIFQRDLIKAVKGEL